VLADIAQSRAEIDQARLLVLAAARQIDLHGAKAALKLIGIAKVRHFFVSGFESLWLRLGQFTVPQMALRVIDRAMQVHGAEGISQDTPLASFYASVRTLRFADVSAKYAFFPQC
jgi:acyl-CoA dehydrogenase